MNKKMTISYREPGYYPIAALLELDFSSEKKTGQHQGSGRAVYYTEIVVNKKLTATDTGMPTVIIDKLFVVYWAQENVGDTTYFYAAAADKEELLQAFTSYAIIFDKNF
ncbi:MAG: hypothetical protein LBQ47_07645 [Endomicrobium sp.]|jgi:hypothetical protein|nr:hypothetical protein [Endomicrobium sp.]